MLFSIAMRKRPALELNFKEEIKEVKAYKSPPLTRNPHKSGG